MQKILISQLHNEVFNSFASMANVPNQPLTAVSTHLIHYVQALEQIIVGQGIPSAIVKAKIYATEKSQELFNIKLQPYTDALDAYALVNEKKPESAEATPAEPTEEVVAEGFEKLEDEVKEHQAEVIPAPAPKRKTKTK